MTFVINFKTVFSQQFKGRVYSHWWFSSNQECGFEENSPTIPVSYIICFILCSSLKLTEYPSFLDEIKLKDEHHNHN